MAGDSLTLDGTAGDVLSADDGITVYELPDLPGGGDATGGVFEGVVGAYRRQGYDDGYRQAVRDVLASLVAASETFIREQPTAAQSDLRRVVLGFEGFLEQRLRRLPGSSGLAAAYVEGGLGI